MYVYVVTDMTSGSPMPTVITKTKLTLTLSPDPNLTHPLDNGQSVNQSINQ